jgi:hypothetical protein
MFVLASQSQSQNSKSPFSKFTKRAQDGRKKLEPLRTASVKNLKDDLNKIAKEELEFSKSLFKQIIPVDISINKNAKGIHKLVPLNISFNDDTYINKKYFDGTIFDDIDNSDDTNDAIIVD